MDRYIRSYTDTYIHRYINTHIERQIDKTENNDIKWITRKGKIFPLLKGKCKR